MSLYLRQSNKKNGLYLQIMDKYWDPVKKHACEKTYMTPGYVSKYTDQYDDPVAHFQQIVDEKNNEAKKNTLKSITIDTAEPMTAGTDDLKNVGYSAVKYIYKELELDKFWKNAVRGRQIEYDPDRIFQMLLYSRILYPGSKKHAYEQRMRFYEGFGDFSLDDVYSALDIFAENEEKMQKWIYDHSVTKYNRDLSVGFFDCTNYYYDISKPDIDDLDDDGNILLKRYRKYGPEKNHRKDPIVEMGLLMDRSGIPLSYDLFPGNESEKKHMLPIINRSRIHYGFGRMIVVADRGLNTSDNIYLLNGKNDQENNPRDGYVYGQSVRGADAEFKEWVLNQDGYVNTKLKDVYSGDDDVNENAVFRHKSRIYPKKIYITRERNDGSTFKQTITVDQKQLVYYSEKYAKKQKLERDRAVERAKDLIAHPKKYDKMSAKGASGYVLNLSFNKDTGEVVGKNLQLDEEKIQEEEKYDGYYSIVTSELKKDDFWIRDTYRGLIRIEDTFKLTKSEFDARPIYVRTNDHIDAHFTVCFAALVIIRLLEIRLNHKYPAGQILESLRNYSCVPIGDTDYQFTYYNQIMEDLGKSLGINYNRKYLSRVELRRLLKY